MTQAERLLDAMVNIEFVMTNEDGISHRVFPCHCPNDCGNIIYEIYRQDYRVLTVLISDDVSLDVARRFFNDQVIPTEPPMTKKNFVDFLTFLAIKDLADKKKNEN